MGKIIEGFCDQMFKGNTRMVCMCVLQSEAFSQYKIYKNIHTGKDTYGFLVIGVVVCTGGKKKPYLAKKKPRTYLAKNPEGIA